MEIPQASNGKSVARDESSDSQSLGTISDSEMPKEIQLGKVMMSLKSHTKEDLPSLFHGIGKHQSTPLISKFTMNPSIPRKTAGISSSDLQGL